MQNLQETYVAQRDVHRQTTAVSFALNSGCMGKQEFN